MRMMAARAGQLLNLNAVANDLGIAQTTARDWLAVLESSYITFRLPPYHGNFGKRLVKTPKLYFHDTGLAAWLLGITRPEALASTRCAVRCSRTCWWPSTGSTCTTTA